MIFDSDPIFPRIAAGIGGIIIAIGAVIVTFGGALIALIAIGIAFAIARRRKRPLTRGKGWLVGAGTLAALLLVAVGASIASTPKKTFTELQRTMDSTAAAPPPAMPEWLRRMTPPVQQRSPIADSLVRSRAFTAWTLAMGMALVISMLASYAGSLGWAVAMLGIYAITGRWLPRAEPVGPPPLGGLPWRQRAPDAPPPP